MSFARAFTIGDGGPQIRGAWLDVVNRNFVRRLHHPAMTAVEQGLLLVDKAGVIRYRTVMGPVDTVPGGPALAALVRASCGIGRAATSASPSDSSAYPLLLIALAGSPIPTHVFQTLADQAETVIAFDYLADVLRRRRARRLSCTRSPATRRRRMRSVPCARARGCPPAPWPPDAWRSSTISAWRRTPRRISKGAGRRWGSARRSSLPSGAAPRCWGARLRGAPGASMAPTMCRWRRWWRGARRGLRDLARLPVAVRRAQHARRRARQHPGRGGDGELRRDRAARQSRRAPHAGARADALGGAAPPALLAEGPLRPLLEAGLAATAEIPLPDGRIALAGVVPVRTAYGEAVAVAASSATSRS